MSQPIQIRRNQRLAAALGTVAAVMAIAYLQRAADGGGALDWLVCVVMLMIAASQLVALLDSRTPLLVADDQGVRVRLGQEWLGLPWAMIGEVGVVQRDAWIREGHLVVRPRDLEEALAPLLPSSKRAARAQRILHGAPLTIPLSIATRTSTRRLVPGLRELAAGRAEVFASTHRVAKPRPEVPPVAGRAGQSVVDRDASSGGAAHPVVDWGTSPGRAPHPVVDRVAEVRDEPRRIEIGAGPVEPPTPRPVAAVRAARRVMRAELVHERAPRTPGAIEPVEHPVRPADPAPQPRPPIVGPVVSQARERAGLDVEELCERTRIRPHVLEGIEADDFGPCGGDFYARGHLRTLARYLGLDADGLIRQYDEHYARAPITASRVFEAELASGMSGGIKVTTGGPRWGLIAAAVLSLLMVWGVARYFSVDPGPVASPITSNSAGLAANTHPITSPLTRTRTVTVHALDAPARVVVRDRFGKVLWRGHLAPGARHRIAGVSPFKVTTSNAETTVLTVGKRGLGPVSDLPGTATRTVG